MQQDNKPQAHKSFHQRMVKEEVKEVNVLVWLSQSLDLKQAFPRRKPTNITEFKGFCTKEWAKTPTSYGAELISVFKKLYFQLLQQKRVTPDTESKDLHTFATHWIIFLNK